MKKEIEIKGMKIEESIYIFGAKDDKWICTEQEAYDNVKEHLESGEYEPNDLTIETLQQVENENKEETGSDLVWQLKTLGWSEILKQLFKKKE